MSAATEPSLQPAPPPLGALAGAFARIGCLSFGGPAAQIALMHREVVEERGWIAEGDYLAALNLCHLLPGPEAQQLATWVGWRLGGWRGGLVCGGLFVLPGALVMLGLGLAYVLAARVPLVAGLLFGIKAAVLAIVAQALWRIGGRALGSWFQRAVALLALVALGLGQAPYPLVIALAALAGLARGGSAPVIRPSDTPVSLAASLRVAALWLAVWLAPLALVAATLGMAHPLWHIGAFFARLALVSFGGAYAALGYMAQAAVAAQHWLSAGEMADGLGLAETTPGPLILVAQFVGFLAGWRGAPPLTAFAGALAGAGLALWMTFAPCFLWIFTLAPWLERLRQAPRLQGALAAITAAVVGVIAQLALWFAGHVLLPAGRPDWPAVAIALLAAVLLFVGRRGVVTVLGVCALAGLALTL